MRGLGQSEGSGSDAVGSSAALPNVAIIYTEESKKVNMIPIVESIHDDR